MNGRNAGQKCLDGWIWIIHYKVTQKCGKAQQPTLEVHTLPHAPSACQEKLVAKSMKGTGTLPVPRTSPLRGRGSASISTSIGGYSRSARSGMIRLKWPSLFFFYLQIEIHELYTPGKVTFPKGSSLPTIIFQGRTVKLRVFFFGKKLTQKVVTRNGLFGGILMRRGDLELDCFDIQN